MRSLEFLLPLFLVCAVAATWLTPTPFSSPATTLAADPPPDGDSGQGAGDFFEAVSALPLASAAAEGLPVRSERDELLSSGAFRLSVPFRTQRDGDRFAGSNCGPASLGMVLEAFGNAQTTSDLRWRSHTYQGTAGRRGGTALQHIAAASRDLGLAPIGLYDGQDFHRWTLDDVRAELAIGRPVMPLVKYRLLPGHETSTVRFDHYVVIYGIDGDRFLYHDPAYESPAEGAARWMSAAQLDAAMRVASVPRQAVAFDAGYLPPLAATAA